MRLSRRNLLLGIGAGTIGVLAASCGGSDNGLPELTGGGAKAIGSSGKASAPRAGERLPEPGEERVISVVVPITRVYQWRYPTFAFGSSQVVGTEFNRGTSNAVSASEKKWVYRTVELDQPADSRWSYAAALKALRLEGPAIVTFDPMDLDDLAESKSLIPLTDLIKNDVDFDPGEFWPGALETGKYRGVQYAMPFGVAPWVMVVNERLASAAGDFELEPGSFDLDAFTNLGTAIMNAVTPLGDSESFAFDFHVNRGRLRSGDVSTRMPSYVFLHAAMGSVFDAAGKPTPLRTQEALDAVQYIRDMVHRHRFAGQISDVRGSFISGNLGMFGWLLRSTSTWFKNVEETSSAVLPFPTNAPSRNPVEAWGMMGIPASADDPSGTYAAMRYLERELRKVTFLPAVRIAPDDRRFSFALLSGSEAGSIVDLMENASYIRISRRARGILADAIDAGILLEGLSAQEAIDKAVFALEAAGSG